jgi:hypothetical protein
MNLRHKNHAWLNSFRIHKNREELYKRKHYHTSWLEIMDVQQNLWWIAPFKGLGWIMDQESYKANKNLIQSSTRVWWTSFKNFHRKMKNHHGIKANNASHGWYCTCMHCTIGKDKFDQVWIENKFDSLCNGFALFKTKSQEIIFLHAHLNLQNPARKDWVS